MRAFLLAFLLVPAICVAQDNFPDVPDGFYLMPSPVFDGAVRLGLVKKLPTREKNPSFRQEMAVTILTIYRKLQNLREPGAVRRHFQSVAFTGDRPEEMARFLAALKRATSTFEREIARLGHDIELMKKEMSSWAGRAWPGLTPTFTDVPRAHWASEATSALKRHGLLEGYPR